LSIASGITGAETPLTLEAAVCLICGSQREGRLYASGVDFEYDTSEIEFRFVSCPDCGHVYLNPRPTIESAGAIYPSNYYAFTGAHRSGALSLLGRAKDVVVRRRVAGLVAGLRSGSRVMEPGCGDGALLISLRQARPDLHLTALDLQFSPATRRTLADFDIEIVEQTLEEARFEEPFDFVVMNQLIEHLWDARRCMASVSAALNVAGTVSISTPNLDGYDRRWFKDRTWGGYHIPRHLNLFTRESLARFLREFGLEVVDTKDLAAPIIWVTSVHNELKARGNGLHRFFRDSNLAALALATIADTIAPRLGYSTSNQQMVARKISAGQ
jgi:2-polyprenyl-3-methyl-5-hydroxy-6-metoxy-1,4-benzoquinol methylase